jgi:hypothetical protein
MFEKIYEFIYKSFIIVVALLAIFFTNVPVTTAMPKYQSGDARVESFIEKGKAKPVKSEILGLDELVPLFGKNIVVGLTAVGLAGAIPGAGPALAPIVGGGTTLAQTYQNIDQKVAEKNVSVEQITQDQANNKISSAQADQKFKKLTRLRKHRGFHVIMLHV